MGECDVGAIVLPIEHKLEPGEELSERPFHIFKLHSAVDEFLRPFEVPRR